MHFSEASWPVLPGRFASYWRLLEAAAVQRVLAPDLKIQNGHGPALIYLGFAGMASFRKSLRDQIAS